MTAAVTRLIRATDQDALIDHAFEALAAHQHRWPDDRAFVIVPEYLKADMERRYITSQQAKGLMMAEVLSFNRLAARLFTEVGQQAIASISVAGKAILTQKALLDRDLPFLQFHRLAERPGYAIELVNILGDFTRYGISADELRRGGDREISSVAREVTRHKFSDFAILKETIDKELDEKGLADPDTLLTRLCELLHDGASRERLQFLRKAHIWIIGFGNNRELTSQELLLIQALSKRVARLTIAVAADSVEQDEDPVWQHGRTTLRALMQMIPEAKLEVLDTKAMAREPDITFIRTMDRREEARFAAGEIRRLLLSGAVRRRDIGVALCEADTITPYLEPALLEYGIAATIDSKRPLQHASFIRMLRAFLALCDYDFSLDDLLDYFRSGLASQDDASIDLFENAALALAWKGARHFRKLTDDEASTDGALARFVDPASAQACAIRKVLADVRDLLAQTAEMRSMRSGKEKCEFLLNFLFRDMEARVIKQRELLLLEQREEHAKLLVAAWNAVIDFLKESAMLLGDTRLSQTHFAKMLNAGFEGLSMSSIPSGVDRVRVGPLNEMVYVPCKVLLILGMTDEAFPPRMSKEGYLLDTERALLSEHAQKPFPSRTKDHPATQAWLVKNLLARPEERLYLSVPGIGDDSSRIYDALLRTSDQEEIILTDYGDHPDPRWYAPTVALRMLQWNKKTPAEWEAALSSLVEKLPTTMRQADEIAAQFALPPPTVLTAMARRDSVSVSMLQAYNECPFHFFTRYMINAKDRLVADDKANLQGTMLHRLLELSVRHLVNALQDISDPQRQQQIMRAWAQELSPAFMRPFYREATKDVQLAFYAQPDYEGGVGERLLARAVDTLSVLALFDRDQRYAPRWLEWYFPQSSHKPYVLEAAGQQLTCRGLIDRVDEGDGGVIRLIDYKRSPKDFSWLHLYDGTDLQMPLYKRAFETAYPDRSVESLLYAGWNTQHFFNLEAYGSTKNTPHEEALKALARQEKRWNKSSADQAARFAEQKAQDTLRAIFDGQFPAKPLIRGTSRNPCQYCPWHSACGYDHRLARSRPLPDSAAENNMAKEKILNLDQGDGGASQGNSSI